MPLIGMSVRVKRRKTRPKCDFPTMIEEIKNASLLDVVCDDLRIKRV